MCTFRVTHISPPSIWGMRQLSYFGRRSCQMWQVLVPSGFEPLRITRAPYFCAGDRFSPVAALDACVIVLKPSAAPPGNWYAGNAGGGRDEREGRAVLSASVVKSALRFGTPDMPTGISDRPLGGFLGAAAEG